MTTLSQKIDGLTFQNERTITIQYLIDETHMWVKSRLKDDYHDMVLYWQIDTLTHQVTQLEGFMYNKPFDDCQGALGVIEKIKGLEIGVGVKKSFRNRFAKEEGCTHITELSLATFDFIIARLYGPNGQSLTRTQKETIIAKTAHFLCKNNSCVVYNQNNQCHFDQAGRYKGKEYDY